MASDMLLLMADEVARNGAFGKILRPEVFPDAPLHSLWVLCCKAYSAQVPRPSPRILLARRTTREPGGGHRPPEFFLSQRQLLLYVDACLLQQFGDRLGIQTRSVIQHANGSLLLIELHPLDTVDLANAVNSSQLTFSRRILIAIHGFEIRHWSFSFPCKKASRTRSE